MANYSTNKFGSLGDSATKQPNILKRSLYGGYMRIYENETHDLERTDIAAKKGTVRVYRKYHMDQYSGRKVGTFTQIEILSQDNEILGTVEVRIIGENAYNPHYKFDFGTHDIGEGSGDIALFIAYNILDEGVVPAYYLTGSTADTELISTITRLLDRKTVY
jgi:hypothetical protein